MGYQHMVPVDVFQSALRNRGFSPGGSDGIYGLNTRMANERYLDSIGQNPGDYQRYSPVYYSPPPQPPAPICDITNILYKTMRANGKVAKEKAINYGSQIAIGNVLKEKDYWLYWINSVQTNGTWDIKDRPEWKQYGNVVIFENKRYNLQDIGNLHYGYVGKAYGMPESILRLGAGLYQQLKQKHQTDWLWTKDDLGNYTFGDDPSDVKFIIQGFSIFNSDRNKKII